MGVLTDPSTDVREARAALRAARRALCEALGDPRFRNFGAACDALEHVEKALAALASYPDDNERRTDG